MTEKAEQPRLEKTDLRLGFIPLVDCCVLAIAREKGFFEKHGLDVSLSREASWANIRDKVCVGALDGAHMLAGMPIATSLGLGYYKKPMVTGFSMNLNGNAVTISDRLYERLCEIDPDMSANPLKSALALKRLIEADVKAGKPPLTFAMVYPYSNHNYEIRYWLAAAGIHPDKDVHMIVIPPQYMVENLRAGQIDGYCVGEPWNSFAVHEDAGKVLITGYEIWNNAPEKVFGVTRDWARQNPATHIAVIKALLEAARWIDQPGNRDETASIISTEQYTGAPTEVIKMSLTGSFRYSSGAPPRPLPDCHVFHRYLANFPWRSHAMWILSQMYRWGQLEQVVNIREFAEAVYRPDIYREAAAALNMACPATGYKTEGSNPSAWQLNDHGQVYTMGPDHFLDNRIFNPGQILSYISAFDTNSMLVNIDALTRINYE